ncbi:uncharacterized protein PAF06_018747 [Gastrophryne carolinensis]
MRQAASAASREPPVKMIITHWYDFMLNIYANRMLAIKIVAKESDTTYTFIQHWSDLKKEKEAPDGCHKKKNVRYRDNFYLQLQGIAMGSIVAPFYANLFMADFEECFVYTDPDYNEHVLTWGHLEPGLCHMDMNTTNAKVTFCIDSRILHETILYLERFARSMSLMTVQVLTIDTENPGNGDKPMVTFDPDWRKMFYNETLTLACLGGKGNQTYNWYRHNNMLDTHQQNFTIDSIQLYDRANYQCQVGKGEISDPDRQHIITDLTIIRVPRFVFEGDILNLACDSRMDMNTTNAKVTFYKDSKVLKGTSTETTLYLGKIDKSMSGKYKCSKLALFKNDLKNSDDEEQIEITELFPTPEIQITPNPIEVASDMTLICVARLHPFRANTELEFAFYRNGWHVRGFSPENKFTIRSVTLEDSGDYACEVRTVKSNVRKMSNDTFIQVQALVWPVVTFSPNWDKVLRNDRVTVTCKIGGTPIHRKYSWYKNNNLMPYGESSYSILYAGDGNIGDYQCQTGSGEKSDPLHLDVFFVWLILQVPTNIHEGDSLMIKCRMWNSGSAQNTTFYKDDIMLIFLGTASDLSLGTASKSLNGKYKCTKFINTGSASKVYSAEEFIMVKELFSAPEVQVSPHSMIEGSDMTLTCQTTLSRSRRYEKLQFAFYKNGQLVQAFEESDKYHVQSVQSGDSGNYTCEVQNILKTVKKMSQATPIQIQGMAEVTFTPNVGKIIDGESLTLTCKVDSNMKGDLNFYWYKDNIYINMTRQSFTLQSANVNDSGYYQCRSGVTHISEPLRLDVSNADLILQAPPIINEGEELVLGCHHRNGLDFTNTEFYKDGIFWKILGSDSTIQLGKAYQNVSAVYRCTKRKKKNYSFDVYTAEALVSIKENFPYLKLKVNLEQVREMYDVVLSCEARMSSALSPLRGKTQLQYAFYKDGTSVQSLGPTNTFLISQAKKENSGNYTCQVKSSTNGWTKISQPVSVDVQAWWVESSYTISTEKEKRLLSL